MVEVAIIGPSNEDMNVLRSTILKTFIPNCVIICKATDEHLGFNGGQLSSSPLLQDRFAIDDGTTVYICKNYVCKLPVNNLEDLEKIIKETIQKRPKLDSQ